MLSLGVCSVKVREAEERRKGGGKGRGEKRMKKREGGWEEEERKKGEEENGKVGRVSEEAGRVGWRKQKTGLERRHSWEGGNRPWSLFRGKDMRVTFQ